MLELFRIAGKIELDGADKAEKSLDRVDKKAEGFGSKLGGFARNVGKAGAVVGGAMAAAGGAAFAMTQKVTSSFDDISKGAQRVGVSTDFYQEMDFWASQNGLSHERMEKAVGRFNQRLGQATNGNEKYGSALQALGVNLDDVRNGTLTTEDAFAQSIQTLSEMENEQDKINLATELFGTRMARDMLPALQDGALSIDEARQKAQELGLVIGEDALEAGVKFQDTWDQLKRSMTTAGQQIMANLIPIFQTMMDWVLDHMPQIQAIFETVFDVIGTVFSTAVEWVQALISWLSEWFTSNEETMTGIWETIQEKFNLVVEFLQTAWETIRQFWEENGQQILENAMTVFNSIWETVQTAFDAIWEIVQQVIDLIVPFLQEKLAQIQQFWDENGEKIMQAVQNAFKFIQSVVEFVMPAIQFVIETVWGIIQGIFNGALNIIMGLLKTFSGLFTGDWSKMWEGIKQLLGGALEFVWNLISLTLVGRAIALIRNFATLGLNIIRNFGPNIVKLFRNMVDGAINLIRNLLSRGTSLFSNLRSSIARIGSRILSAVRKPFDDALSFIKGLGSRFLQAGRNIIDSIVSGIKGAIGKVKDAIGGVAETIRSFLPFSPAKEGPLKDLDKLDFGGPIEDSIDDAEISVQRKMEHLLTLPNTKGAQQGQTTYDNRTINITVDASNIEELLQVIEIFTGLKQTVRQG